jgi:pimeloyl-ACP methyl ester carboxylesterase
MTLLQQLQALPTLGCALPFNGFIRYRESTSAQQQAAASPLPPLVLLHGIGSGSGGWLHQLQADLGTRVLAWDAPGYADSTSLPDASPQAQDYGARLWAWLDALGVQEAHLVGHSLGCIMAASAARLQPQRVRSLRLLAPAQGYGPASEEVRVKKRDERLQAMAQLGLQAMAQQRAPHLLASGADVQHIELATHLMSQLNELGYAQATRMLSLADIRADLRAFRQTSSAPITVACGELDAITPAKACQELAQAIQAPYVNLGAVGHVCAMEAHEKVNQMLEQNDE